VLRAANRWLSASLRAASWKVSSLTIAGTAISTQSSRGRWATSGLAETLWPCSRAGRVSRAGWSVRRVLENAARPA
jgi:hypothetical protein